MTFSKKKPTKSNTGKILHGIKKSITTLHSTQILPISKKMSDTNVYQSIWDSDTHRIPCRFGPPDNRTNNEPFVVGVNRAESRNIVTSPNYKLFTIYQNVNGSYQPIDDNMDDFLNARPTFRLAHDLFGMFTENQRLGEIYSEQKQRTIDAFWDLVSESECMKRVWEHFRIENNDQLKQRIKRLWFDQYTMSEKVVDVSGFEHCMVGEMGNREVKGYHYWYKVCL